MGSEVPRSSKVVALAALLTLSFTLALVPTAHGLPLSVGWRLQSFGERVCVASSLSSQSVDPSVSSSLLARMGVRRLRDTGLSGRGVTVAVVDTGLDPSRFPPGTIVDWVDVTAEGVVITGGPYRITDEKVKLDDVTLDVSAVPSRSGYVRIGRWSPSSLGRNSGLKEVLGGADPLMVVVTDPSSKGVYDTVYVDANEDGIFSPGEELPLYSKSQAYLAVYGTEKTPRPLVVVLSDLRANGQVVVLGFDGHGHGTASASILAGKAGGFDPICPDIRIIAIKAVDSSGMTTWELVSGALNLAAERGAEVVLVSIAPKDRSVDSSAISETLERVSRRCLVVLAAGNSGPGLGSLPSYAGMPGTLVVGGYMPSESQRIFGVSADRDLFWPWSSCGPNSAGVTVDLVAPAVVPALFPVWKAEEGQAYVFEGTSAAAACVAGAACLATQKAKEIGLKDIPEAVRRVLVESAEPLDGIPAVEQGAGAVNAGLAVDALPVLFNRVQTRIVFKWNGGYQTGAFWDRSKTPGMIPFTIDNLSPLPLFLRLEHPGWLNLKSNGVDIPAASERSSALLFLPDPLPGLYSGFLIGDDPTLGGTELRSLITIVKPRDCSGNKSFSIRVPLETGRLRREYFHIPLFAETLKIELEVGTTSDRRPRGRGSLVVYDPEGKCVYEGPWIGAGTGRLKSSCLISMPSPGTWEAVVVTDPLSQSYGVTDQQFFQLSASAGGMVCEEAVSGQVAQFDGRRTEAGALVKWLNSGPPFAGQVFVSDRDKSYFERKRLWVSWSASTVEALPRIGEGIDYLYVSIQNPHNPEASLALYLYKYDEVQKKWVEVPGSLQIHGSRTAVFLENPPGGEYVAYIEAGGSDREGTYVEWVAVMARAAPDWQIVCDGTPTRTVKWWAWNEEKRFEIRRKVPASSDRSTSLLFTVWDAQAGKLKGILPVEIQSQSHRPVVSALKGETVGDLRFMTLKAWDRQTGKPVDACVCVGELWYQLFRGEATFLVPTSRPAQPKKVSVDGMTFLLDKVTGEGPAS
ncbi:MAG: S8 family serine peptidase [Firmicutes bacterium]|nr:S8 family serine peptidase [Candidatus Fermentithermobacillaceae bacterium]